MPVGSALLAPTELISFPASRQKNSEARRWYANGGASAVVLTTGGALLEPHPTFGPHEYRLLALNANFREASEYAYRCGFIHVRDVHFRNEREEPLG